MLSENTRHPEMFLETHGSKLIELDIPRCTMYGWKLKLFELCPNLTVLLLVRQNKDFLLGADAHSG